MRACIPLQIQVILINHAHFWADQLNSCTHALFQRPLFQNYRCLNCNSSGILNKYLFFWCPAFCSDLNIGKLWKKKEVQEGPQESSALFTQLHSISSAGLLLLVIVQPYLCSVSCTSGPAWKFQPWNHHKWCHSAKREYIFVSFVNCHPIVYYYY